MYEIKKWKGIYEQIRWDRALVLWKRNLPGRGLTEVEKHWYMSYSFADSLWAPLLCGQRKTPDDGQRNCPKHVEFYSKNKFEKFVHLVGFIVRICLLRSVKGL